MVYIFVAFFLMRYQMAPHASAIKEQPAEIHKSKTAQAPSDGTQFAVVVCWRCSDYEWFILGIPSLVMVFYCLLMLL